MGLGLSLFVKDISRRRREKIYQNPSEKWRTGNSIFDTYARAVYDATMYLNRNRWFYYIDGNPVTTEHLHMTFRNFNEHVNRLTSIDTLDMWKIPFQNIKDFAIICLTYLCYEWKEDYSREGCWRVIKRMEMKHIKYLRKRWDLFPKELYPIIMSY